MSAAPTSQQIYGQMQDVINQQKAYTPANQGDVYSDLVRRVGSFEPQYQELRGQEAQAYAAPAQRMQQYAQQFGQGTPGLGRGPGAMSMLSNIMGDVGRQYGTANVMRDVIGTQRGRLEDMSKDVYGQYQAGREALTQRYGMLSPLYQGALQREEAARARAAAARAQAQQQANWRNMFGGGQEVLGDAGAMEAGPETVIEVPDEAGELIRQAPIKYGQFQEAGLGELPSQFMTGISTMNPLTRGGRQNIGAFAKDLPSEMRNRYAQIMSAQTPIGRSFMASGLVRLGSTFANKLKGLARGGI